MVRQQTNYGFDLAPLLPLGVLLAVMFAVFTPLTVQVMPLFMDTAHQMLALLWVVPVVLVGAMFLSSSDFFSSSPSYNQQTRRAQAYKYYPQTPYYATENTNPRWGLLGFLLLMLLLLPWRY